MLKRLLPERIDNAYHGYKVALWLFGLLVFMKMAISVNSIVNGYSVASTADGIPLDTFTPAAAQSIVTLFALLGLGTLMICLLCILILVRYRAMVPLMFVLFLVEFLSRRVVFEVLPIQRTGTPPAFYVNLALLAVMVVGLALSLWNQNDPQAQK